MVCWTGKILPKALFPAHWHTSFLFEHQHAFVSLDDIDENFTLEPWGIEFPYYASAMGTVFTVRLSWNKMKTTCTAQYTTPTFLYSERKRRKSRPNLQGKVKQGLDLLKSALAHSTSV